MNRRIRSAMVFAALLALAASAAAIESGSLGPEAVKKRWHSRLAGMHFSARVQLSMDMGGIHEESVRNVGVLFLEQQGRPNDYFLYQPELRRVRRLPEAIASDDVYGIDLEFLGFGVAQSEPTEILDMAPETLDGRPTYRLRERALRPNPRFEERLTWIDASSFIPVRTEQFRAGAKRLVARTTEIRDVRGVATPTRMEFENTIDRRKVLLRVAEVDYDVPIPEEYFSTMALVRAKIAAHGSGAAEPNPPAK